MTSDHLVGALLDGRYRVETTIATGGMSTVYRGYDIRLDRPVALKVMDARYAGDHQFLTRFQREARAIARLKNPGLVAIYDQGGDVAHPFLVMELVDGSDLRETLARFLDADRIQPRLSTCGPRSPQTRGIALGPEEFDPS